MIVSYCQFENTISYSPVVVISLTVTVRLTLIACFMTLTFSLWYYPVNNSSIRVFKLNDSQRPLS